MSNCLSYPTKLVHFCGGLEINLKKSLQNPLILSDHENADLSIVTEPIKITF